MLLGVVSCQNIFVKDPTSALYIPSPGSEVIIHSQLTVPAGTTRVFLQHGKIVAPKYLDEYDVNCNFEINHLADTIRYIEPGRYIVTKTRRQTESIVSLERIQLVSADITRQVDFDFGGDASMQFEIVKMQLQGNKHSNLRELACRGAIADPVDMQLPTLAEIRQALGDFATIVVPEEASSKP